MNQPETNTPVGIVVIGRNEGERLHQCLTTLRGDLPLVYVDSGSTDGSVATAGAIGAEVIELDPAIPFSAARARNEGFARLHQISSQIRYVQFVDGDCILADGWINAAIRYLDEHPAYAVVAGRLRERFPSDSIYNRLCDLEWNTPIGDAEACGGIAMYRADAFGQAGRFDATVVAGEEPELCLRLRQGGWKIRRLDTEMALHDAAMTRFGQWWRRAVRGGYGGTDVARRFEHGRGPFSRQVRSARLWTITWSLTALLAMLGALVLFSWPVAVLAAALSLAILPLQVVRIALKARPRCPDARMALAYAALTMLSKWAHLQGQYQYWRQRRRQQRRSPILRPSSRCSAWRADLARYPRRPFLKEQSIWAIAVYRFGRWNDARRRGPSRWLFERLYWLLFRCVETLTGISFTKAVEIGPGLRIWHFGNVFIHADVRIGANCTLRQGVTIGNRVAGGPVPIIEDDVDFGAYAQVLGSVRVGRGAKLGAMSVVLEDVPPGATAVGVPARVIQPKDRLAEQIAAGILRDSAPVLADAK